MTVATRAKTYPHRSEVHHIFWFDEQGKKRDKWIDDPGGVGWEIAREIIACPACATRMPCVQRDG